MATEVTPTQLHKIPDRPPPVLDRDDYRGRNVDERNFEFFKQWPGLVTRYDKLALTYRGAAVKMALTIWSKALGATP